MPNGESKNWIRFCAAINGFRARYKKWPISIAIPHFFAEELEVVLNREDYRKLTSMVNIVDDGSPFVAKDEQGNFYDYNKEGFSIEEPDIDAVDWFEISPDYHD